MLSEKLLIYLYSLILTFLKYVATENSNKRYNLLVIKRDEKSMCCTPETNVDYVFRAHFDETDSFNTVGNCTMISHSREYPNQLIIYIALSLTNGSKLWTFNERRELSFNVCDKFNTPNILTAFRKILSYSYNPVDMWVRISRRTSYTSQAQETISRSPSFIPLSGLASSVYEFKEERERS